MVGIKQILARKMGICKLILLQKVSDKIAFDYLTSFRREELPSVMQPSFLTDTFPRENLQVEIYVKQKKLFI